MPVGQAILSALYGDPANQISRTLNPGGPNPNPNPGAPPPPGGAPGGAQSPGGSGGPSGAPATGPPQPQPPMAPSQATQSPPDLASLYVQLHKQDMAAAGIDRGLQGMASAFGTAQQQHDMMNQMGNIQPDDRAGMLGKIMVDQKAQQEQQEHNRFMAGAGGMASLLGNQVTPEQAQWLALNPDAFNEMLRTHQQIEVAKNTPTEAMKNVDASMTSWQQANPNATPQQIAAQRASLLSGLIPGPGQQAAIDQAKSAQDFKDNAMSDYSAVNDKLSSSERIVSQLMKDPGSTMAALRDPSFLTTGALSALPTGIAQGTKDAASLINQLSAGLAGENLGSVKNVRNRTEFDALRTAVTGAFTPGASQTQVMTRLQEIQQKFLDAHATNEMAAGHHISGDLVGHGQTDLLSPTLPNGQRNPYYNGATSDSVPKSGGGGFNYAAIPSGTVYTAPDGTQRRKP